MEKARSQKKGSDRAEAEAAILDGTTTTGAQLSAPQDTGSHTDNERDQGINTITLDLSGEVPKDVNPQVWTLLLRINQTIDTSRIAYQGLDTRVQSIEDSQLGLGDTVSTLAKENTEQKAQIDLLFAKVSLLEKKISQQSVQNNDIITRSMSQNIVITSSSQDDFPEEENEDCTTKVSQLLARDMRVPRKDFDIIRAHRLGSYSNARCRPIVARLASKEQVITVLKHGTNLKGTKISVNQQLPPSINERRQFSLSHSKTYSRQNGVKTRMSADKLYVNNELQRQLLPPSLPDSTPNVTSLPTMTSSLPKNTSSFMLQAFTCDVRSFDDVRHGYDSTLMSCKSPDVLAYAYRFEGTAGKTKENYDSGGDFGAGLQLLKWMQANTCQNKLCVMAIRFHDATMRNKGRNFRDIMESALTEIVDAPHDDQSVSNHD